MNFDTMDMLLYISASVALLALAGLFIYIIVFLKQTRGLLAATTTAVQAMVSEVGTLSGNLQGTIKNLEGIAGQMETTVVRVNALLDEADGIAANAKSITNDATEVVHGAKNIVVSVLGFVDNVQTSVQRPIGELASIISAVGAWVEAFRNRLGLRTREKRPAVASGRGEL